MQPRHLDDPQPSSPDELDVASCAFANAAIRRGLVAVDAADQWARLDRLVEALGLDPDRLTPAAWSRLALAVQGEVAA